MNERRTLRLMREALNDPEARMPDADGWMRAIGIVALVLFVVTFSGSYPV
jgi:hypothetical protein